MRLLSAITIASACFFTTASFAAPDLPKKMNYAVEMSTSFMSDSYLSTAQDKMIEAMQHLDAMAQLTLNVLIRATLDPAEEEQYDKHATAYRYLRDTKLSNVSILGMRDGVVILNGDREHPVSLAFPDLMSWTLEFNTQDEAREALALIKRDLATINHWLPTAAEIAAYQNNPANAANNTAWPEGNELVQTNSPEIPNQLREMQTAMHTQLINMQHYATLAANARNRTSFEKAQSDYLDAKWDLQYLMMSQTFDKVYLFREPDTRLILSFPHQNQVIHIPELGYLQVPVMTNDFPTAMANYIELLAAKEKIRIWLATGELPSDENPEIKGYVARKIDMLKQQVALKKQTTK